MRKVEYIEWQHMPYGQAWEMQTILHKELIDLKLQRKTQENVSETVHKIIFCEHRPPVYTLGKSGDLSHLLLNEDELKSRKIDFYKINRGGDITYHGPGQITGYPILDLDFIYTDIHRYVRTLESAIIETLADYDIQSTTIEGYTGVWIKAKDEHEVNRKICAIGVHLSRWVTMHGFALNVNTDLSYFNNIIPCGINDEDKSVTSMQKELGKTIEMDKVRRLLLQNLVNAFDLELINQSQ